MTNDEIYDVAEIYIKSLSKYFEPSRQKNEAVPHGQKHALWMCHEIQKMVNGEPPQKKRDKAMRWLGFVQGVLWSRGIYSIDDMRSHNVGDTNVQV